MKPIWTSRDRPRWLRRAANRAALWLGRRARLDVAPGLPRMIMIEPTNLCNLHCPLCPTGAGTLGRAQGRMPMDTYRRVLCDLDGALERLLLWNYGEPFMHPQALEMIALAREAEVHVRVSTNGLVFSRARAADELIQSGLNHLRVSLDGASDESYRTYRVGGDLARLLEGVRLLQARKRELGRARPLVELQFIVMRHNQHELPAMRALAHELGTPLRVKTVGLGARAAGGQRAWLPSGDAPRRYDAQGALARGPSRGCDQPWHRLVVNWDGSVTACCYDRDGAHVFGNAGNAAGGLQSVWNGAPLRAFRRALRSAQPPAMCRDCAVRLWGTPHISCVEP